MLLEDRIGIFATGRVGIACEGESMVSFAMPTRLPGRIRRRGISASTRVAGSGFGSNNGMLWITDFGRTFTLTTPATGCRTTS